MATSKAVAAAVVKPCYWEDACKHLSRKDRVMKRLIAQSDGACLQTRGDPFTTLARSIVGQQISVKAAQTVWDRFAVLPRKMTAANVLKLKVDDMRAAVILRGNRANRSHTVCAALTEICWPTMLRARVVNASPRVRRKAPSDCAIKRFITRSLRVRCLQASSQ